MLAGKGDYPQHFQKPTRTWPPSDDSTTGHGKAASCDCDDHAFTSADVGVVKIRRGHGRCQTFGDASSII